MKFNHTVFALFTIFIFCTNFLTLCKTAVLVIAHRDFQPREYGVTKQHLEKAGITVLTASNHAGDAFSTPIDMQGRKLKAHVDKTLNELTPSMYDGIFFIGGGGSPDLDNQTSYNVIKQAVEQNKIVGAICYAPRILARAGILNGKEATGWNNDRNLPQIFKQHGVTYKRSRQYSYAVTDGNIITATDPMAAEAFAQEIISAFKN